MEFSCRTVYTRRALAAMSKAIRKTTRRGVSILTRVFSWIIIAVCLLSALDGQQSLWIRGVDAGVIVMLLAVQFGEDTLSAIISKRRAMPGMEECATVFHRDCYESRITGLTSQWQYSRIQALVESGDYLVVILGKNHAQAFDKAGLEGGTVEEFRCFLEERTGKTIRKIGG